MFSYQIVAGYNTGKDRSKELLYKRFFPEILENVLKLTHGSPDAEDIAIEIIEDFLQDHKTFESMDKIRSNFFVVVQNRCSNYLRDRKIILFTNEEMKRYDRAVEPIDIEACERKSRFLGLVYNAIERLPERRKAVFKLYYLEDLKDREIAERLGITVGAVERYKRMAKKTLRMEIPPEDRYMFSIIFL